MKVWGLNAVQIETAVNKVSRLRYENNLIIDYGNSPLKCISPRTKCFQFTIRGKESKKPGTRLNTGLNRCLVSASWEAYRDVMEQLFIEGAIRIKTRLKNYTSYENFLSTYKETAYVNIDSQTFPIGMIETTWRR